MALFWFAMFNAFSGQTLFDEWLYQLYNITFTFLAIMWFAIFDLEYDKETLLTKPKYYIIGLENMCFSNYKFFKWIFYAMWQSIVLILLSFIPFEQQGGSLWLEGNFVYLGIIIIVNINVLTATNSYTWISLLFQVGSIVLTMIAHVVLNFLYFSVLYGSLTPTYGSLEFYYILLLMLLAIVQVDIGVNYVNKKIRDRMIKIARGLQKKIQTFRARKSTESAGTAKKQRKTFHRGFAFDQDRGNAPQVMNYIKNDSLRRKSVFAKNEYSMLDKEGRDQEFMSKTHYKKAPAKKNGFTKMTDVIEEDSGIE
jgi:phospholipid-transporting ATPase